MGKPNWNVMNSLVPRLFFARPDYFFAPCAKNSLGTRLGGEDLKMRLWFLATYCKCMIKNWRQGMPGKVAGYAL